MNKHQTLVYIKYGKMIDKINDEITVSAIKSDMINFLLKFPGTLKQPETFQFNPGIKTHKNNTIRGRFKFEIKKLSKIIFIDFDGKNNFKLYIYNHIKTNIKCTNLEWMAIDNIEYYVDNHLNDFNNIIE